MPSCDQIISIADSVRQRCVNHNGSVKGHCREIALAVALEMRKLGIHCCVCQGLYIADDGEEHSHCWNRYEQNIIDASIGQFEISQEVSFVPSQDSRTYIEESFFIVQPQSVWKLISVDE